MNTIDLLSKNLLQLTIVVTELQKQQKNLEQKLNMKSLSIDTNLFCDSCNKLSVATFICSTRICANIVKKCRLHITPEFLDNIFCDECLTKNEISDYIEYSED